MLSLAERVDAAIAAAGLPAPVAEYRFHPKRLWRFDRAWPEMRLAIEIDGGAFTGGRHNTGAGATNDDEKINEAQILGWCVLRFTVALVKATGQAPKRGKRKLPYEPLESVLRRAWVARCAEIAPRASNT